jgi:murein DD-endopeptidase MepM/ murein hydrolase activator NlpD
MPPHPSSANLATRGAALWVAVVLCLNSVSAPAAGATHSRAQHAASVSAGAGDLADLGWVWPAGNFRLARMYVAPAHEYGPGHRGIDLALLGSSTLISPADGTVAFAGSVAGRGVLTIDHGGGLVTTLEPVDTSLMPGASVHRGEEVATLGVGGHSAPGELHFGVRLDGRYINPMLLLDGVPRAILLPCCD